MNKKILAIVAAALLLCMAVGGTIAYLTATTEQVTNTFTPGYVSGDDNKALDLWETNGKSQDKIHDRSYKIVPGVTDHKDPQVSVTTNIPAYLFIRFTESNNTVNNKTIIEYTSTLNSANGWTQLAESGENSNVWYRIVNENGVDPSDTTNGKNATYTAKLLAGDLTYADGKVSYNPNLTNTDMLAIKTNPVLKWEAWTIQRDGLTDQNSDNEVDADDAWALVKDTKPEANTHAN